VPFGLRNPEVEIKPKNDGFLTSSKQVASTLLK